MSTYARRFEVKASTRPYFLRGHVTRRSRYAWYNKVRLFCMADACRKGRVGDDASRLRDSNLKKETGFLPGLFLGWYPPPGTSPTYY